MKIKLTEEQQELLEIGTKIFSNFASYYSLPFWFKATKDSGVYEIYVPTKLPDELLYLMERVKEVNSDGIRFVNETDKTVTTKEVWTSPYRMYSLPPPEEASLNYKESIDENCFKNPLTPDECYEKL